MKKINKIENIDELHQQVQILKLAYKQKGEVLKTDVKTYVKQFSLTSVIKKYATPNALLKLDEHTHITSKLMAMLFPIILNGTLFKKSGFITKAIMALTTSKIGNAVDAELLTGIFNYIKTLLFAKKSKASKPAFTDYGIPPDSETY